MQQDAAQVARSLRRGPVELRIEELALIGFDPRDRHRIGDAVERELMRLFSEQGIPASLAESGNREQLETGSFHAKPGARAETTGAEVAHAVFGQLAGMGRQAPARRSGSVAGRQGFRS